MTKINKEIVSYKIQCPLGKIKSQFRSLIYNLKELSLLVLNKVILCDTIEQIHDCHII